MLRFVEFDAKDLVSAAFSVAYNKDTENAKTADLALLMVGKKVKIVN